MVPTFINNAVNNTAMVANFVNTPLFSRLHNVLATRLARYPELYDAVVEDLRGLENDATAPALPALEHVREADYAEAT
jgi:hypothetical protein